MVDRAAGAPLKKLTPLQTARADIESVPTFCFCPAGQKLHLLYYLLFLIFYLLSSPASIRVSASMTLPSPVSISTCGCQP